MPADALGGALHDAVALELGDGGQHVDLQASGRRLGVEGFGDADQAHPQRLQGPQRGQNLIRVAAEAIQPPDQHGGEVAGAGVGHESGALGPRREGDRARHAVVGVPAVGRVIVRHAVALRGDALRLDGAGDALLFATDAQVHGELDGWECGRGHG